MIIKPSQLPKLPNCAVTHFSRRWFEIRLLTDLDNIIYRYVLSGVKQRAELTQRSLKYIQQVYLLYCIKLKNVQARHKSKSML